LLGSPTTLQYTSECSERWVQLLAYAALPVEINLVPLTTAQRIQALVLHRPPSFTNDTLRLTYPSLLHQPTYMLKDFLDSNEMAQSLYNKTSSSDTYGLLRLKLMGCVVAIVQDQFSVENVDSEFSRSDIFYIAHVGGILRSSR